MRGCVRSGLLLVGMAATPWAAADKIDDFARAELKRQQIPGMAIAVVRDGKITKAKGYGYADLDHKVPVSADTVFALASITKPFTATLTMMLVEEGKVRLDDDISQYLADPPATWKGITVRHLLNHTGGLSPLGQDFLNLTRTQTITTAQMYQAAKSDPIGSKPGEAWSYSDVGYFLLGMIIERATGKTYRQFLQERILDPTGMSTARLQDLNRPYPNLATGYTLMRQGDTWEIRNIRRTIQVELSSHFGLFGTVKDLAKWDKALYGDALIEPATFRTMLTPAKLNDGKTWPYGFGWGLDSRNGYETHNHSGITGTYILRVPSVGLTVIVLSNLGRRGSGMSQGANAQRIANVIAGLAEPKLQWKAVVPHDEKLTAKARQVFEAFTEGQFSKEVFTDDAIRYLIEDRSIAPNGYADDGALKRIELLDRKGAPTVSECTVRLHFAKRSRVFNLAFDDDGKVLDFVEIG